MEDLYKILGVAKTANADEIKKAYRSQAMKYHPDRNPGNKDAEEKFKKINAAYSILADDSKRKEYDMYGSANDNRQQQNSYGYNGYKYQYHGNEQYQDPFEQWFKESQNYNWRGQYDYETSDNYYRKPKKSSTITGILSSAMSLCAGIVLFKYSLYLFPFGPIFCIAAIANGITGIIRGIKMLIPHNDK